MTRILIAEDEARISSFVRKGLTAAGYTSAIVATGPDALEAVCTERFDLVLLDIGLPGIGGLEVLAGIREVDPALPVIMLTARTSLEDVVVGLDAGASDYVSKPFRFDELLARVRSRLREADLAGPGELVHGGVRLELHARRATLDDRVIDLSAREFLLAEEFLRHPGEMLTREHLLRTVWGVTFDPGSNVVDVYVRYLREKFGREFVETIRGSGYRLP
jgi:DNA-binding response OmpR family regulator